jgi:simple sugar transport system permease protein
VVSLLAVLLARLLTAGLPWPAVVLLVLLAGVAVGLLNGVLTVYGDIPSFIVTLGTASVATGLAYTLTGSVAVPIADLAFLDLLSTRTWAGVPVPLLLVALLFAATAGAPAAHRGRAASCTRSAPTGRRRAAPACASSRCGCWSSA